MGLTGQALEVDLGADAEVAELTVGVVHDDRHSAPTQLLVSADEGEAISVDVPDLGPVGERGSVRDVTLRLPRAVQGTTLRVEIGAVEPRHTTDWYSGEPIALPVALAELRVPGSPVAVPMPPERLDSGCRDDLLTLDGAPLAVRITGTSDDALARRGLDVAPCGPGPLALAAGSHELRAAPGARSGLDLDRLVLATPGWQAAAGTAAAPTVEVSASGPVSHEGVVTGHDGAPFWLVLDQSVNEGWELDVDGASVDGPRPMGSYAGAWYVQPDGPDPLAVSATYGPQRAIDLALVASALAAAACLLLALGATPLGLLRRHPRRSGRPRATSRAIVGPQRAVAAGSTGYHAELGVVGSGPSWWAVAGLAVVAALAVHPLAAVAVAGAAALARRWPALGRVVPVALVAAAGAGVAALQLRYGHELTSRWPSRFGFAHLVCLGAVVLLAGLAVAERDDR